MQYWQMPAAPSGGSVQLYNSLFENGRSVEVSESIGRRSIGGLGDASNEAAHRLTIAPPGQYEPSVVGLAWRIGIDRLIDHQVTTVTLHCGLEAVDCLEQLDEFLGCLSSGEVHAA
jgi:hypothetical protein